MNEKINYYVQVCTKETLEESLSALKSFDNSLKPFERDRLKATIKGLFAPKTATDIFKDPLTTQEHNMIDITTGLDRLPEKQYLIQRLELSPGNLNLLCATGCSGKTMLIQYIATCVSGNTSLFGQFPVKHGGVIHIDQEQSQVQTLRRYIRLANGLGVKNLDIMRTTLKYRLDAPEVKLDEVEDEIVRLCTGKALCIIDSLKASTCADENSGEIEVVLKMMKRAAQKSNCAILCVHHKGKGKDAKQSGRGHSSIYDSADVQIDLDLDQSTEIYELTCAKNREGKYFDGVQYMLSDEGSFNNSQNCTEQLKFVMIKGDIKNSKQKQKEKITEALVAFGTLKYNDLFDQVKGDRTKLGEVLSTMINNKELVEAIGPRNAKLYSLTEDYKASLIFDNK